MSANALQEWYHELIRCNFRSFNELKQVYGNASLVSDDRVVFNIMGNKYRLVVRIVFQFKVIQIKWFGTHAEYEDTDMTSVNFKKKKS
ncbi:MAG: type II toxin-antitoxin system HigB family toxin [Bacteroidota bacterium]